MKEIIIQIDDENKKIDVIVDEKMTVVAIIKALINAIDSVLNTATMQYKKDKESITDIDE